MSRINFISIIKEDNKIIPMEIDAKFYQNRASRYLERKNYPKALKCYWKIIDLEPDNPCHYFNIASVLSDMGLYKESNELLLHIVEKLDYNLPECYYFLANNYMLLDNPEMALIFVQRYIEIAPNGDLANQAKDMKAFIIENKDCMDNEEYEEDREKFVLHSSAKSLLDNGNYDEAIKKLINLLDMFPDFLAARNNLALAYFYAEKYEKAIEQIRNVLEQDFTNIHALCNLTVFYKHLQINDEYECLLSNLRKIVPYNKEQVYKLATTFAILGEHDLVFKNLSRLVNKGMVQDVTFIHYCALSAFNTRRYDYAKRCWEQIIRIDSDSKIARYYLEVVLPFNDQMNNLVLPSSFYQYKLPLEQLINIYSRNTEKLAINYLYCSLLWILINGEEKEKEQVILSLIIFDSDEAEQILRNFLVRENESEHLKKKAIISLEKMHVKLPYSVHIAGKIFRADNWYPEFKLWKKNWLEVLTAIDHNFNEEYNLAEFYDAKLLLYKFVSVTYPNTPEIYEINSWVAAIDYMVAQKHNRPTSYFKLSQKYQVNSESVYKNVKEIARTLKINTESIKLLFDY